MIAQADLRNWRDAPQSAWAFRNIAKILPAATIVNDVKNIPALQPSALSIDRFELRLGDGQTLSLEQALCATATDGFLVLKDGRVVVEHYGNGNSPDQPHIWMSASKSLMGLLAGIMVVGGAHEAQVLWGTLAARFAACKLVLITSAGRFVPLGPQGIATFPAEAYLVRFQSRGYANDNVGKMHKQAWRDSLGQPGQRDYYDVA